MKKILTLELITGFILIGLVGTSQALLVSDMQLNGQDADAVSAVNVANDKAGAINNLGGLFAGNEFSCIAKDETVGGSAATGSLGGIDFTLDGFSTTTSGTWTVAWSGSALPATIDLVGVLKGSKVCCLSF